MKPPIPSLESLHIFVRAAELGSFSAAGRSLRMSAQVVSYRIQALETELSVPLFVRTTRRMSLTERGRVFYEHCLKIVEAVEQAQMSIAEAGDDLRGTLRVTAPLGLGRRVVGPLAATFRQSHPGMDVRLRLSEHLLDLVHESIDVALRLAHLKDSGLTVRKIAEIDRVLCAAPAYLAANGTPQHPDDLLAHRCLLLRYPGAQQFRWTLQVRGKPTTFRVAGPLDADDGDVLTDWGLAGEGIVLKPKFEVAGALADGRLVEVLPSFAPPPVTLAALYPARRASPSVRAFVDALVAEVRAHLARELAGEAPRVVA